MEGGVAGKSKATLKRTTITGNHASRDFLHKLNELRWSKTLVDVVLVGEESRLEIPAHKLLLAACSPYFNSRFLQLMLAVLKNVQVVPACISEVFKVFW